MKNQNKTMNPIDMLFAEHRSVCIDDLNLSSASKNLITTLGLNIKVVGSQIYNYNKENNSVTLNKNYYNELLKIHDFKKTFFVMPEIEYPVTKLDRLFKCTRFKFLDLNNINTNNITSMIGMLECCPELEYIDIAKWNMLKVSNTSYMFACDTSLKYVDFSNQITAKSCNVFNMFINCISLEKLDLDGFGLNSTSEVKSIINECTSLKEFNKYIVTTLNGDRYLDLKDVSGDLDREVNLDTQEGIDKANKVFDKVLGNASKDSELDLNNPADITKANEVFDKVIGDVSTNHNTVDLDKQENIDRVNKIFNKVLGMSSKNFTNT